MPGLPLSPVHFDHLRSAVLERTVRYSLISGPVHVRLPVKVPYPCGQYIDIILQPVAYGLTYSVASILTPEDLCECVQLTVSP